VCYDTLEISQISVLYRSGYGKVHEQVIFKCCFLQVGFESTAFQLMDIAAGTSQVVISRRGTYGALLVAWTAGYAPGLEIPEFIVVGNMTPILGKLLF
jgi:hypothetical protein